RRLPPARDESRGLVRTEPSPSSCVARGPRRPSPPLAGLRMTLLAEVETRVGALDLRMRLEIHDGEVVALLGPNGAGKTTMLRAIAGLVATDSCRVELDGEVLEDSSSGRYVPTEQRSIGFVFQDYLLFPHLNVVDHVAFRLRARGQVDPRRRAMEWIDRVGRGRRGASKPSELCGGEPQQVATAR